MRIRGETLGETTTEAAIYLLERVAVKVGRVGALQEAAEDPKRAESLFLARLALERTAAEIRYDIVAALGPRSKVAQ